MLNRCSENYIETTSNEHVEIPPGKRRQKNFHFQPVCQRCFNATGHIGLTLNQRQNACRDACDWVIGTHISDKWQPYAFGLIDIYVCY